MQIPLQQLRRTLTVAATLEPMQARAVVAMLLGNPLVCGAREDHKQSLAEAHWNSRQPVIQGFRDTLKRHLDYAKHETLRNLEHFRLRAFASSREPMHAADAGDGGERGGIAADLVFDKDSFAKGLLLALRNESANAVQAAGDQLYEEIGKDDVFSNADPKALDFLDARQNLLSNVPEEVHAEVMGELQEGLDKGESIRDIAKRISGKFDQIDQGRAETIAMTETAAAYGYGRQAAMESAGVPRKRWLTSHRDNVRPAHTAAENDPRNKGIPVDQPFVVGGEMLMYPSDSSGSPWNVINCHCISLAMPGLDEGGTGDE